MSSLYKKHRKIVLTVSILLLLAAIAWAAAELSGQANAMAMDAGSNSAEMESASLETLKKPKNEKAAPNCDWAMERDLRHAPNHDDLKRIHSRLDEVSDDLSKLMGEFKGTAHTLSLIHEHLLNKKG